MRGDLPDEADYIDALQEESGGTAVFADKFSQQELASYLKQIETDIKNK